MLHSAEFSLKIYNQRYNSIWSKDVSDHKIFINNKWLLDYFWLLQFWLLHSRNLYVHIQYNVDTRARVHTKWLAWYWDIGLRYYYYPQRKMFHIEAEWIEGRHIVMLVILYVGVGYVKINLALLIGIMYLLIH